MTPEELQQDYQAWLKAKLAGSNDPCLIVQVCMDRLTAANEDVSA